MYKLSEEMLFAINGGDEQSENCGYNIFYTIGNGVQFVTKAVSGAWKSFTNWLGF